jgi:hypothetical protein
VPPGALAVSGGPQRNLEGWVVNRRPNTPAAEAAEKALASTQDFVQQEKMALGNQTSLEQNGKPQS